MIKCTLEFRDDVADLFKVFSSEKIGSDRADLVVKKGKTLVFKIIAKDPVAMKAITSSILKIVETYQKTANLTK